MIIYKSLWVTSLLPVEYLLLFNNQSYNLMSFYVDRILFNHKHHKYDQGMKLKLDHKIYVNC